MTPGLRERKKQATRRRIASAALELFAVDGFEQVPVSRVARAAEVSEATVFNYFPTKEDLVYDGMTDFESALLSAVRDRPAGVSVVAAFRDQVLQPHGLVGDQETVALIAVVARIITESPALLARERQVYDRYTAKLAELLSAEPGLVPWVTANALVGVNRALQGLVHEMAAAGQTGEEIATAAITRGTEAFAALERGLA